MRQILDIQKLLLPDLTEVLKKRYTILHHIQFSGIIGRRALAANLDLTERVLRAEVDFLKEQGLLESESTGMMLTESGKRLLADMEPLIKDLLGLSDLEEQLKERYDLDQVVVVPGDWDHSSVTKKELGRAGAAALRKFATKDGVIAVTGGSTLAEIAEFMTVSSALKGSLFVPARGGLGESVELQANTIASTMAKKTGGQYRLLHVPDHLGEEAYQTLMQDSTIRELVDIIRHARIVVHGIGDAMVMARRRKVDPQTIEGLQQEGALAEAFGYYFDRQGKVVHRMPTVGLRIEDIQNSQVVIAVAGGRSKGEAIASVMRYGHNDVLVTDEAAAQEILKY
ncbi:sugar-binding transcriptional regulator [Paenibacillus koleovorans]|uniref:sugar-binding transcriptional regulator n=1 Tax=Paenibacillus koleovorans TaxID=121608 RepID=UPI000FDCC31D|nr:sugar-binding domain-containing protein [Paenibacillus koleovorans]